MAQVGPFANPNEVYAFYSLPYCAPTEIETKRENLGALLKGDRPTKTRYDLKFRSKPKPASRSLSLSLHLSPHLSLSLSLTRR